MNAQIFILPEHHAPGKCVGSAASCDPSAGHQFPGHNRHENGYTGHITPEPSVLKLFMIYHGSASQEGSYYDMDTDHSARRKHGMNL